MAKNFGIYKCGVCGNTVEMIEAKEPNLVCCGQEMSLMEEKNEDKGQEKHVPVLQSGEDKVTVTIGNVPHPMEDNHFIELVELLREGKVIASKWLYPGMNPEASFFVDDTGGLTARIYCNVHGTWKN